MLLCVLLNPIDHTVHANVQVVTHLVDPETHDVPAEFNHASVAQLVTQGDFLKHGAVVFVLSFIVLWGWAFLGYWRWIGFDG